MPTIFYSVRRSEETNFPDNSFDAVAPPLHWFKFGTLSVGKTYCEAGVFFAVGTYSVLNISAEIDLLISGCHYETLGGFLGEEKNMLTNYSFASNVLEIGKNASYFSNAPVGRHGRKISQNLLLHLRTNLMIMKNTPFTGKHIALGAKMAAFAGYNMPISYSGINDEHAAVRKNAGVFDVSHMGEFILKGDNALDLIQRVTSNDAAKLKNGQAQYSCLPNDQGGIVDDLLVYCIEENNVYMLVVNASNIEKDWKWISQHNTKNVEMHDISGKTCLLAIQGPNATKILQPLTEIDILNLKYYTFVKGEFAGVKNVLISATGYTGAGGVEIYFEDKGEDASAIWDAIFTAGEKQGIKPVGLGARDTLRLEMGFCLYGNDIDDNTSPLEAGLGWITKFSKEFTAKDFFEKQKAAGVERKLVGFEMIDKGIPRQGYEIKDFAGVTIGVVTSGTQSPSLGKAIGMGYVRSAYSSIDSNISIKVRDKLLQAKVVKMPFS